MAAVAAATALPELTHEEQHEAAVKMFHRLNELHRQGGDTAVATAFAGDGPEAGVVAGAKRKVDDGHLVVSLPEYEPHTFDAHYLAWCSQSLYKAYLRNDDTGWTVGIRPGAINSRPLRAGWKTQTSHCFGAWVPVADQPDWCDALYAEHTFESSAFAFRSDFDRRDMSYYVHQRYGAQPRRLQERYPEATGILERIPHVWESSGQENKDCVLDMCRREWVSLRNGAYSACASLNSVFVAKYSAAICETKGALFLTAVTDLVRLIAAYAADLPFDITASKPVLTVEECTPDAANGGEKRQRLT